MLFRLLAFILAFLAFKANAQLNPVDVFSEKADDGYDLYADNRTAGTITILVDFTSLQNYRVTTGEPYLFSVPPGRRRICSLEKIRDDSYSTFRYTYRYNKGCMRVAVDEEVKYLLPVAAGKRTRFSKLAYLNKEYGEELTPENWNGGSFSLEEGDTVYAMRRGKVVEIEESKKGNVAANYTFAREVNYVIIEHEDCSMARYSVLAMDQVFPQAGDIVEAGDPIALAGGTGFSSGHHVRILVYSLDADKFVNGTDDSPPWIYMPLRFVTVESEDTFLKHGAVYTCNKPENVIFQEMSKRDIKRYKKLN